MRQAKAHKKALTSHIKAATSLKDLIYAKQQKQRSQRRHLCRNLHCQTDGLTDAYYMGNRRTARRSGHRRYMVLLQYCTLELPETEILAENTVLPVQWLCVTSVLSTDVQTDALHTARPTAHPLRQTDGSGLSSSVLSWKTKRNYIASLPLVWKGINRHFKPDLKKVREDWGGSRIGGDKENWGEPSRLQSKRRKKIKIKGEEGSSFFYIGSSSKAIAFNLSSSTSQGTSSSFYKIISSMRHWVYLF